MRVLKTAWLIRFELCLLLCVNVAGSVRGYIICNLKQLEGGRVFNFTLRTDCFLRLRNLLDWCVEYSFQRFYIEHSLFYCMKTLNVDFRGIKVVRLWMASAGSATMIQMTARE